MQTTDRQKQVMQKHADTLAEILAGRSMNRVVALRRLGEGFKKDSRDARLNQKTLFRSFVDLYPERFAITRDIVSMASPAAVTAEAETRVFKRLRRIGPIDKFLKNIKIWTVNRGPIGTPICSPGQKLCHNFFKHITTITSRAPVNFQTHPHAHTYAYAYT